jgi:CubicO group peptidase (beta-lactamase class C family)
MTKLQFRVLYREFLFRVVDLELLAPQGDISKLLGQFAALLVFVSLWILLPSVGLAAGSPEDPESSLMLAWMEGHFLVSTTMLAVGLFAVLSWESMFPDRRDVLVLSPLPVRGRTLFLAKVAAVATALGLTVAALDIFPGLVAPFFLAGTPTAPPPKYDPAMAPVSAAELQPVLDRDLVPARSGTGALATQPHVGLAVGVLKHGDRRVFTYGTAAPDSIFEIGSITKTFTGLLLAQMVEQGKARLDEPVRELLPAGTVLKPNGNEITLLDLATHHSGLPWIPDNLNPGNLANYHAADLYGYIGKHGLAKPANAHFLYSNLGFGLLGQALANRAGMSYPELLQTEITGVLGMADTAVKLSSEQTSRVIQGYNFRHWPATGLTLDALAGAGAIRSTAGDMLTYLDTQLHPDRFPALAAALRESHQLRADAPSGARIALSWIYDPQAETYWHNGATLGYHSYAFFSPKDDYATVVLVNTAPNPLGFAGQLGTHIRERLIGLPARSLANPLVPGHASFGNLIRSFAAFWIAMAAAGAFILGLVLTVQGFAQLLPRQWFLRLSVVLQLTFFCLLLMAYFLQPAFSSMETLMEDQRWLLWVPSYWFFALFQQLNGPIPPELAVLARRAWIGLVLALCGAASAYLICYFRTLRKIAEQPDIQPASKRVHWLPRFGGALPTAVVQFSIRTLLRSRQHRVILSFYLGLAFGIAIFLGKAPELRAQLSGIDPWHHLNAPMLVASIVMMAAAVLGARIVFSMPLDLRANWVFRVTPIRGGADCLHARRRSLFVLSVVPIWLVSAAVFLSLWPWHEAIPHLLVLGLLGTLLAEVCLYSFRKIPFTCSYLPGRTYAHMAFASFLGLIILVGQGNRLEKTVTDLSSSAAMIVILGVATVLARWRTTAAAKSPDEVLQFEEMPDPAILPLGLSRDGAFAIEPTTPAAPPP